MSDQPAHPFWGWSLQHRLEFLLARLLQQLPVTWTSQIGAWLGARKARDGLRKKRLWVARLQRNFERFEGITDPAERERRIIRHMADVGRVYAEFMVQQKMVRSGRVEIVNVELIESLLQTGQNVIIAGCHLANWEIMAHLGQRFRSAFADIYVPPENPVMRFLAEEARSQWLQEAEFVEASTMTMRHITRAIEQKKHLCLFMDEERDGYVHAPSLGRSIPYAGNRWLGARLAARYGLAILPVHVQRVGTARYQIIVDPLITAPQDLQSDARARYLADRLDDKLNQWIRPQLDQWYWLRFFDYDAPPPQGLTPSPAPNPAPVTPP